MALTIDYRLTGSGWAACSVSRGEAACEISASYLSDALGNLLLCAYGSVSGFSSASFGFDEEPGEYRWVVRATGANEISLEILAFDEVWSNAPDSEGKSLFGITCEPLEFAEAALAAADKVLGQHGIERYKAKWVEPFPEKQLSLLRKRVEFLRKHSTPDHLSIQGPAAAGRHF